MFNKKNGYQFQNLTVADASGSERSNNQKAKRPADETAGLYEWS